MCVCLGKCVCVFVGVYLCVYLCVWMTICACLCVCVCLCVYVDGRILLIEPGFEPPQSPSQYHIHLTTGPPLWVAHIVFN